jgi:hypothetical protein
MTKAGGAGNRRARTRQAAARRLPGVSPYPDAVAVTGAGVDKTVVDGKAFAVSSSRLVEYSAPG